MGEVNDRAAKGGSNLVWALKDLTFEVKQGEILGIIGKNGAGKSTLLKLIVRSYQRPQRVVNQSERENRGSLLEVGTGFHPELNRKRKRFSKWGYFGND